MSETPPAASLPLADPPAERELTYHVQLRVTLVGSDVPLPASALTPQERSQLWGTAVREICRAFGMPPAALVQYAAGLNAVAWTAIQQAAIQQAAVADIVPVHSLPADLPPAPNRRQRRHPPTLVAE